MSEFEFVDECSFEVEDIHRYDWIPFCRHTNRYSQSMFNHSAVKHLMCDDIPVPWTATLYIPLLIILTFLVFLLLVLSCIIYYLYSNKCKTCLEFDSLPPAPAGQTFPSSFSPTFSSPLLNHHYEVPTSKPLPPPPRLPFVGKDEMYGNL